MTTEEEQETKGKRFKDLKKKKEKQSERVGHERHSLRWRVMSRGEDE